MGLHVFMHLNLILVLTRRDRSCWGVGVGSNARRSWADIGQSTNLSIRAGSIEITNSIDIFIYVHVMVMVSHGVASNVSHAC